MKKKIILSLLFFIFSIIPFIYGNPESDKINKELKLARSLLRKDPAKSGEIAGSLLNRNDILKFPSLLFDANLVKAGSFVYVNMNSEALKYLEKCKELITKFNLKPVDSSYYQYLGTVYSRLSNYKKALKNLIIFLNMSLKEGDDMKIGIAYNNIGLVYNYLGNHEKTLTNLFKTLKIMEKLGKRGLESKVLNNIGICQAELKNYDHALTYYKKSLKIKTELNDKEGISNVLNNIGQAYFSLNNMQKSLEFTKKAEKIAKNLNIKKRIATTLTNIGRIYMKLGKYKKGEKYLLDSLKIKNTLNDKWEIAFTLKNLAELYLYSGEMEKALSKAKISLDISENINSNKLTTEILLLISKIYKNQGRYKDSLEIYSEYTEKKEKFVNEKVKDKIEELKITYETEKMDDRIKFLEKENELKNRDINNQKRIQQLFIALSLLLSLIMILIYFAYRIKLVSNKKLLVLNSSLEDKTVELKKALLEVKTLTGLLPVCSTCKKVRGDDGKWSPMEEYIKEYSDASVTHSICPDCKAKIYK